MKHMISLGLILLMLSTMLVFTTKVASAQTASPTIAAASCYDTGCDGKSPVSTGCENDAITEYTYANPYNYIGGGLIATVYLRFSRACQATWAKVVFNQALASGHYGDATITRDDSTRKRYHCDDTGGNGWVLPGQTSCYTPMLGDAYPKRSWASSWYWTNSTWNEVGSTASY